ncbi:MAG TPA: MFS transporter [Rhodospirillales bacterium]|jgi:predicted MFS family arabinose efflux permease|nr:MFS transporter [Rhodospirillales bacterium]
MRRNITFVILAAGLISALNMGIRSSFGLFLPPMTDDLGIGYEAFAFSIALQQIFWGLSQPLAGMIADKLGAARVLVAGAAAYTSGLIVMSGATTALDLDLGAGLLIGFGIAATGFPIVLGAVSRLVSAERRSLAFGIATVGGSFGQFVMAPISQGLIDTHGWAGALIGLALLSVLMAPLAMALAGRAGAAGHALRQSLGEALSEASRHGGYWYLNAGFFVCGFQILFITVHFPAYIIDSGLTAATGAAALALIGFFNIFGTYMCGFLGTRWPKKYLLSSLYFLRSLVIIAFLLLPKSEVSVLVFASAIGLLWLGTIPLTSALVAHIFGVRYLSTLFGIVFFSHQMGSFLGVWMGGYLYDLTGSYDGIWITSILLGLIAAALHLPITEKPLRPQEA